MHSSRMRTDQCLIVSLSYLVEGVGLPSDLRGVCILICGGQSVLMKTPQKADLLQKSDPLREQNDRHV